ncbi:Nuclear pore glycoprotein p62 [Danaus plexippus plexippus]|uniref:Nuclear pore glycoprotein p62 n=1 Tax=Danaus plexippus plexippus TaxID=278856 RepID=A0A212FIT7_DANPL|nr:Nuclear pore glycoprotein p62 [Danaus plexippus plexippus]
MFGQSQPSQTPSFGQSGQTSTSQTTQAISFSTSLSTAQTTSASGLSTSGLGISTSGFGLTTSGTGISTSGLGISSSLGVSTATAGITTSSLGISTSALGTTTTSGISLAGGLSFAKTTTATSTTPSGITALGKTAASVMPPTTVVVVLIARSQAPPAAITSINFAELQENINKWSLSLEEQERVFYRQATTLNAWDRLSASNGEKILELNEAIETLKNEQQSLEHELDFVLAQQKELEDILTPLEKNIVDERVRDPEREHMYSLAETLDTQLRQMSEDLKEVIEHLNETNRNPDNNDPIVQIGRILNAHMSSMQWIDSSIAQITTKLDGLRATHDALRKDNQSVKVEHDQSLVYDVA